MYQQPTSRLFLFFLFSLFYHLPCASSKQERGWCEALFQCGDIAASFPFWGGNRPKPCGHASLELHCNSRNITSLNISGLEYNVSHINQTSDSLSLRLARTDLLGSFCSATFKSTTLPSEISEVSPMYKSLTIFHLCNPSLHYLSTYTCPGRGIISAYQNPKYHSSCQGSFTVNVPTTFYPEEKELNLTHLESVLRKGFEVAVITDDIPCEECSSSTFEHYKRCNQPFRCGNRGGLLYPFWIPGRQDCGHPDFMLDCSRGFAELSISSVLFRILQANYKSGIVRFASLDYINNLCGRNPLNVQYIPSVLPFAPDTDFLKIHVGCQDMGYALSYYKNGFDIRRLDCGSSLGYDVNATENYYVWKNMSFTLVNLKDIDSVSSYFRDKCEKEVNIPASGLAFNTHGQDNLTKVLEEGFELQLNRECSICMKSKGACGYNKSSRGFVCYCNDGTHGNDCVSGKTRHGFLLKATRIVPGSVAGVIVILVLLLLLLRFLRKRETRLRWALIPLKHYSYAQVKRMTKSFAEVVGRGGFGIVYKGTLCDGRMVAVKVLKDSKGNGEDFTNEVASISQTSHLNIVSLLGFCSQGSKRAIIYEFLENGSLDKFLSGKTTVKLDWMALYRIALGVARGLEYLHHGCKTRIVHFDIKPQNVLLDENFCPKVSDFGLAKLCAKKESALSLMDTRGTVGYIAPEMISRAYGSVSSQVRCV
ncbi:unnamed protein product [Microthlaspi erraticum]|uniref:non-specific serine/threonine protein kinase n=1 Tax=Microthlaspi erraticum TaxID=1685480 RepID=A0A6D2HTC7_9BRAS|nr:unnamed protein product [Microthlaspi erraticum]